MKPGLALVAIALILLLTLFACTSDTQRIRETNEAAYTSQATNPSNAGPLGTPLSTPPKLEADISIFDVRAGDCVEDTFPESGEAQRINIVSCTGTWDFRVLSSFVVEYDDFPEDEFFTADSVKRCDRRFSYTFFPEKNPESKATEPCHASRKVTVIRALTWRTLTAW